MEDRDEVFLEVPELEAPGTFIGRISSVGEAVIRVEALGKDYHMLLDETLTVVMAESPLDVVITVREKGYAFRKKQPATIYDDLKALAQMQKKYPKRIRKMFMKFIGKLLSKAEIGD